MRKNNVLVGDPKTMKKLVGNTGKVPGIGGGRGVIHTKTSTLREKNPMLERAGKKLFGK